MRALLLSALLLAAALAGCANEGATPTPTTATGGTPATTTTEGSAPATDPGPDPCAASPARPDPAWRAVRPRVRVDTTHGEFVIALDTERAPLTACNFLNLTRSGFYDGVAFHRVVPGFVIQGGDANSKDEDASNDGHGGPGYEIPDEFNPTLRHDAEGVVSMATAGPDTGGSQFFVTLKATPELDDRHAVFGRVVEGMEAVRLIGTKGNRDDPQGRPTERIVMEKLEVLTPLTTETKHDIDVHPVVREKRTEAGRPATFAVVLLNRGTVRDEIRLEGQGPAGWTVEVDGAPVVPAGTGRVVFAKVTPPSGATGKADIRLAATSAWNGTPEASALVSVAIGELGEQVQDGDRVRANYAGFLPDGRLFDTSMAAVGQDAEMPKFQTLGGWRERTSYSPFTFTVGGNVIAGFTTLAKTARAGETVTMRIPAADAYAFGDMYDRPLTGRDLVFELEILEIVG